ncbi:MAG: helix-turn-helix transcriptional regulator [Sphingomonadales bacterium]|nr:helix-turn-helix transcriptional regulator [Sphingomonadales bacterium]
MSSVSVTHAMTGREREIVDLISSGCTSKEIANALGMSINTVLWHRKNLYRKLAVSTRSQLIRRMRGKDAALHIQA